MSPFVFLLYICAGVQAIGIQISSVPDSESPQMNIYMSFCVSNEIYHCGNGDASNIGIFQNCTAIFDVSSQEISELDIIHKEGVIQAIQGRYYCDQLQNADNSYIITGYGDEGNEIGISALDLSPIGPAIVDIFCDGMNTECVDINSLFPNSGSCTGMFSFYSSTNGFQLQSNNTKENCLLLIQEFKNSNSNEALIYSGLLCNTQCTSIDENPLNTDCSEAIFAINEVPILTSNLNISPPNTLVGCDVANTTFDEAVFFRYIIPSISDDFNIEIKAISDDLNVNVEMSVYSIGSCSFDETNCYQYSSPSLSSFGYSRVVLDGTLVESQNILIAAYSTDGTNGKFTLTVTHVPIPLGESCTNAYEMKALISAPFTGTNEYSTSRFIFDDGLGGCTLDEGPVVFYQFLSQFPDSSVQISICEFPQEISTSIFISLDDCLFSTCPTLYTMNDCLSDPIYNINNPFPGIVYTFIIFDENGGEGEFNIKVQELGSFVSQCSNGIRLLNNAPFTGTTLNSETSWQELSTCGGNPVVDSPTKFYIYTTEYSFGDLTIQTCFTSNEIDTFLTVYRGSCSALSCVGENDNFTQCGDGSGSFIQLTPEERLPFGTDIFIAVHTNDLSSGEFTIIVNELNVEAPANSECVTANFIENSKTIFGSTTFSTTERNMIVSTSSPQCTSSFVSNQSPTVFYSYTTIYNYAEITIDTCGTTFDSFISVFTGTCDQLVCIGEDDNSCINQSSRIILDQSNRQIEGTNLYIAVFGGDSLSFGSFSLTVTEVGCNEPPNSNCFTPTYITDVTNYGTTCGSGVLSSEIAPCLSIDPANASPTVFYSLFTEENDSTIQLDFCSRNSFDSNIAVFTGSCDNLVCETVTVVNNCIFEVSGFPSGTELLIALYGSDIDSHGDFIIVTQESFTCNPEGPEYNCATSFPVYTDHFCDYQGTSQQCATIPTLDLGECFDSEIDCGCETIQTSGPQSGDELTAGIYQVTSYAVNDNGFTSNECSYRVNVLNTCDPLGPQTICRSEDIKLYTSYSCDLDGQKCAKFVEVYLARCSDYTNCACTVSQISGPQYGDKLLPGNYEIVMTSESQIGYQSALTCTIPIHVH